MAEEKILTEEDMETKKIDEAFHHLIESYLESPHRKKVDLITKAFNFARHAHKGVRRLSGEPYIMHPLAVAQIVCEEIGLGSTSICSALLHDVVEDTDYTVEDIENMFGPKIAQIVDGLTKISGGIFGEHASEQAENFKKLLLTMSDDIRVILVKIADRLHNMRTLDAQPVNKQYKISGETLYIYAPLANRLGLNAIKTELEDLSFKHEHPNEYNQIVNKLASTEAKRKTVFDEFIAPIRAQLDAMGLKYIIKQRIKSPYSIWHKMQTKNVSFEDIYDILAVRIIFEPIDESHEANECFDIYVKLCKIYKSHPDRLRDWVSRPKANGYQALHITLMSNMGEWIEVQIRSKRMDEIAEKGFAAHWKYKEGDKGKEASESELDKWLVTIKEILDDPQPDAMDFLNTIKLNLFASEIFVFTPKGEIRTMPTGSTALDFAFSIHTLVGTHCIGAKVNHKLVPISHVLQSGDQVEILTSKAQHVQRSWLDIATTAKATNKIMAFLRKQEKADIQKGEALLDEFLKGNDIVRDTSVVDKLCHFHGFSRPDQLYSQIGSGKIILGDNDISAIQKKEEATWRRLLAFGRKRGKQTVKSGALVSDDTLIDGNKSIILNEQTIPQRYTLCPVCNPIPGDSVLGYTDDEKHTMIHKLQCPTVQGLMAKHGDRALIAHWQMEGKMQFLATIQLRGIDEIGLLNKITEVISRLHEVNIHRLEAESNDGLFVSKITFYVQNTDNVKDVIAGLRKINDIKEVIRI